MRNFFLLLELCLALIISSSICFAQVSTSSDLLNNAKQYDGKTVNYEGEVIGDVMVRGDYAWLHVNDGSIAIGIWAPKTMIQDIGYVGDYHKKGDTIEVFGTFHRSCPEHGGDLDIHASEIKKITSGSWAIQPISRKKVYVGVCFFISVLLLYVLKKFFQSK